MAYAWNGRCYQDTASALNAFKKDMTSGDAVGINSFSVEPSISGTGLVSWSIVNRPLSSTDATTRTGTTQLLSCDESADQWPVQSLVVVCALAFAVFIGFRSGFRS